MVFVDSLTSFPSQRAERYDVIKEIKQQLEAYQQLAAEQDLEVTFEISKWEAPRVLSFSLKSKHLHGPVDMDVLPAFNALGETPTPSLQEEGGSGMLVGGGWRESHETQ